MREGFTFFSGSGASYQHSSTITTSWRGAGTETGLVANQRRVKAQQGSTPCLSASGGLRKGCCGRQGGQGYHV